MTLFWWLTRFLPRATQISKPVENCRSPWEETDKRGLLSRGNNEMRRNNEFFAIHVEKQPGWLRQQDCLNINWWHGPDLRTHFHLSDYFLCLLFNPAQAWGIFIPTTAWGGGADSIPPPATSKSNGRIEPREAAFESFPRDLPKAYLRF